jgi:hypothetical protein
MWHQVENEWASGGVVIGTQITARLVHEPVNVPLAPNRLAIDGDTLPLLDSRTEFTDDLAIDADPPGGDQLITMPARTNAGMSEVFVEAVHGSIVSGTAIEAILTNKSKLFLAGETH